MNNIKALNFFESVNGEILNGKEFNTKIININITEKATGEIFAGVGTGTDGSSFSFGIKENNYLGRGVKVDSNLNVSEERIKGRFLVSNPNYKNLIKILIYHLKPHPLIELEHLGINLMLQVFQLELNLVFG